MTPEQYRRGQELYEAVEQLADDERAARLAALCPDDADLRERVLEMLRAAPVHTSKLDTRIRALLAPGEGSIVGPYRLVRLLGEGGMGAVWLARQERPIERDVALKLIRPGFGTRRVVARFEAERQASSRMQHRAIARVYDAGVSEQGLPYFAMEYVDGPTITEFCDRERLGVRERLALFALVCQGVQHAHQKAVLHRDLKPSNVLVAIEDGRPAPKIIDFGIAKALEAPTQASELATEFGAPVGTPAYMSPERLLGEPADIRSDVYSLGMILFELLCGTLPFAPGADREAIRRAAADGTLPRPSELLARSTCGADIAAARHTDAPRLAAELRRDLDWIVMQATAPDPARRYASVTGLQDDVAAYLERRPVRARPPSAGYLWARFVRRHRVAVGVAALATVLAALGIAGTTAGLLRAREAERQARHEAAAADQSLDFLVRLFEQVDPTLGMGPNVSTRELLDAGARRIAATPPEDPAVLARLQQAIGRSYWALSMYDDSERLLRAALETQLQTLGERHPQTLRTRRHLAELHWAYGSLESAEEYAREAFDGNSRALGASHPETLDAQQVLVSVLGRRDRLDEARQLAASLLDRRRATNGPDALETAAAMYEFGALEQRAGRLDDAERLLRASFEIRRRRLGAAHLVALQSEMALADLSVRRGDFAYAEPIYRRVRTRVEEQWGSEVKASFRLREKLGEALYRQGRWAEARVEFEAALAGYRRLLADDHPDTLSVASRLGQTLVALGNPKEALPLLRAACEGRKAQFGSAQAGARESCAALAAAAAR